MSERGIIYLFPPGTCSFAAYRATSSAVGVKWPESGNRWDVQQLGEEDREGDTLWCVTAWKENVFKRNKNQTLKSFLVTHTRKIKWHLLRQDNFPLNAVILKAVGKQTQKEKHMTWTAFASFLLLHLLFLIICCLRSVLDTSWWTRYSTVNS